jgi:hypothetical protein
MPARRYPADSPMLLVIPLTLNRQYNATTANAARVRLPCDARLVDAAFAVRASGGTSPTLTIDVQDDGVTLLTTPTPVTAAGGIQEASIVANPVIAKDSVIALNLAIGGTSPTFDDITATLTFERM